MNFLALCFSGDAPSLLGVPEQSHECEAASW